MEPRTDRPTGWPVSAFLVERYVPATARAGLAASVTQMVRRCAGFDPADRSVGYLQSFYLPSDETCFCLFQAPTLDAVRAVNDEGQFALDRITPAVLMIER